MHYIALKVSFYFFHLQNHRAQFYFVLYKQFEYFCQKEVAEAEAQIPEVMSQAKFTIDNNGTVEELYKKIDEVVNSIAVR